MIFLFSLVAFSLFHLTTGSFEPYQLNGGSFTVYSSIQLHYLFLLVSQKIARLFLLTVCTMYPTLQFRSVISIGLISAVAGRNFAIVASDSRMIGEGGYLLESRNYISNRLWSVDDDTLMADIEEDLRSACQDSEDVIQIDVEDRPVSILIGSAGCAADSCELKSKFRADFRAAKYFGHIRSDPDMVATMLSSTLYKKRFFPYYAFCVVAGLDQTAIDDGKCYGKVYVYDAIGSYERVAVAAVGTGRELLQPILDRLFVATSDSQQVDGTAQESIQTLCKAYRSVSEREIGVGDKLVIHLSEVNVNNEVSRRVFVVPLKQH